MKNKRSYNLRTMNSSLFSLEEKSTILEKLFDSEDAENIFFSRSLKENIHTHSGLVVLPYGSDWFSFAETQEEGHLWPLTSF